MDSVSYNQDAIDNALSTPSFIVRIPDITREWVLANVLPQYLSSYVLRVLNSLLYVRCLSNTCRQSRLAQYEQETLVERISSLNITLTSQRSSNDQLAFTSSRLHCLIHGDDTNIDEDMWRLYKLYRDLYKYENHLEEEQSMSSIHEIRAPFPQAEPQLQLMLKDNKAYLQSKPEVKPFDKYRTVSDDQVGPPVPILAPWSYTIPQYRTSFNRSSTLTMEECQQLTSNLILNNQNLCWSSKAGAPSATDTTCSSMNLPDICGLNIRD
ncbi:hypothetical protein BX616_011202 [Lobosporangium transversale]|nr:hypothetical protein BX616_011202 [Lobosporangium transversale]